MSDPDLQSELSDLFEVDEQDGPDPALIAARRRLVRRALITVTVVMTVALASIVGYVFWALNAPLPSPVANTRSLEAPTTQAVVGRYILTPRIFDHIRALYAHAIEQRYRFFSYGDSMLLRRS